jgi:hypothetical protein
MPSPLCCQAKLAPAQPEQRSLTDILMSHRLGPVRVDAVDATAR